ncbi:MAG: hypothetical protein CMF31_04365 [Kordiimonas sp.]|nr:hypothetical protein [Kordiimonas sp.]
METFHLEIRQNHANSQYVGLFSDGNSLAYGHRLYATTDQFRPATIYINDKSSLIDDKQPNF